MCLWAHATTSAIHVRLILPGSVMGDYPPGCAILPFTRIWPFSALVDNPWKWCASCWRKIAISNNVGSVKYVIGTQLPALGDERHFALADGLRFPIEGSLVIVAVRNSVRPNHLFDHNRDHDYFFALPWSGEWDAQSLRR